jgi:hypothetical protein
MQKFLSWAGTFSREQRRVWKVAAGVFLFGTTLKVKFLYSDVG